MTTELPSTQDAIAKIYDVIDDIIKNPEAGLSADASNKAIEDAKKKISFYGLVIPSEERHFNLSIVNWHESYLRNFHTTALIGFLHRMLNEYFRKDFDITECPDNIFQMLHTKTDDTIIKIDKKTADDIYKDAVKSEVLKYVQRNFKFNPDIHVDKSYKENINDPERVGKYAEMLKRMENPGTADTGASSTLGKLIRDFESSLPAEQYEKIRPMLVDLSDKLNAVYSSSKQYGENLRRLVSALDNSYVGSGFTDVLMKHVAELAARPADKLTETEVALLNQYSKTHTSTNDILDIQSYIVKAEMEMKSITLPLWHHIYDSPNGIDAVYKSIPPIDTYLNIDRYISNHYEQLREATGIIYNMKPDIEFAVQVYEDSYPSKEAADIARRKIQDRVCASVVGVDNTGWHLLGPFKQNRERVEFYNKNTDVVKRMFEQTEQDHKLGKDMLDKRIKDVKKKNVVLAGEDAKGLDEYKAAIGVVEAFGKKNGVELTKEERDKLHAATRTKEMYEVPEGAIQADIYRTNENGEFVREKMYTQAEAPTFIQDNKNMQNHVKKLIADGTPPDLAWSIAKEKYTGDSKKITSRDGKTITVGELKDNIK